MKATSIKEYQTKFQPDMSPYMENAWSERKAQISKNFWKKFFAFFSILLFSFHAVSK
jgi:hypothetical protein